MELISTKYAVEIVIFSISIPLIIRTMVQRWADPNQKRYTQVTLKVWGLYLLAGIFEIILWVPLFLFLQEKSPFPRLGFNGFLPLIITFLAADLAFYLNHRLHHKIRILWAAHITHHSIKQFTFADGVRVGFLDDKICGVFIPAIFVFLGVDALAMYVVYRVCLDFQLLVHTNRIAHIPLLDTIFNTPSNHRVHHSSDVRHLDKNLGGYTMLWDHVFRTYHKEEKSKATNFGITRELDSSSLSEVFLSEYRLIREDWKKEGSFRGKCRSILIVK